MVTVVITKTKDTVCAFPANTIKNNLILLQPIQNKEKDTSIQPSINQPQPKWCNWCDWCDWCNCCECYHKDTTDARCCGLCFHCGDYIYCENKDKCCHNCITSNLEDSCCFKTPNEYFASGCFLTSSGYGNHEPECFCTLFAGIVLCKFALTFPFLLCSILNGTINCVCDTNKNYLF